MLARSARMGTLNQTSPKKPGGPGKWVRSTGIEMNISDMDDTHLKNAAAMCRRNAESAHGCVSVCGVEFTLDVVKETAEGILINKAIELETELANRHKPKATPPAWAVEPANIRVGQFYRVDSFGVSGVFTGKVRVVRVVEDNTDDQPMPYYEVTVRYIEYPHSAGPDVRLCGPQIKYHLRRVAS